MIKAGHWSEGSAATRCMRGPATAARAALWVGLPAMSSAMMLETKLPAVRVPIPGTASGPVSESISATV